MGFGEHIFDLLAGPDIPVRHPVGLHLRHPLGFQSLALSYTLHDGEGQSLVQPLGNQIDHNVVTGTDGCLNGCLSLLNQGLGISQPHIRAVGQAGNPHQVGKVFGLGVKKHLHCKVRTKLRHSQSSQGAAADILRLNPKGFRILEQAHNLLAVQRDVVNRINPSQILKHSDHGGIIVSQNVQLQQVVVNGVIVKMGCNGGGGHIVGRVLHRSKGVDLLSQGKHDDAPRMLSRSPPHSHAALNDAVDLAVALSASPFLIIFFHIAEGRLVRQGADGPCPEGLALAEDNLRVVVGLTLVFSGKVQVNIRLLVPLKSEESFKWNIKSVLFQERTADRAFLIRHIAARHAGKCLHLRRVEIIVAALGAVIVGA